jgi:hypothetical protein
MKGKYPMYPMMDSEEEDNHMMNPMMGCPMMQGMMNPMMYQTPMASPMMMNMPMGCPMMQGMMNPMMHQTPMVSPMMMNMPMGCPMMQGMMNPMMGYQSVNPMMDNTFEEK